MPSSAGLLAAATPTTTYLGSVEQQLHRVIVEQRGSATSPQLGEVWSEIAEVIQGGKRTRPMLVKVAHQAFGGTEDHPTVGVGCAAARATAMLLIWEIPPRWSLETC